MPASKTVARRMLSSGIDLQARESVATSKALAGRGCVMPLLTSLPALLNLQQLALLPPTDVIANSVSQLSHSFTGVFTRTYPLPHLLIISLSLSHAPAKAQGGSVGRGAAHVAFTGRHATNTSSQY